MAAVSVSFPEGRHMQRPYICNSENRPNENEATKKKNKQRAKPKAISKTTLFRNAITKAKTVLQDFVGQFSFLFFFSGYRAHRLPVTMGCPPFPLAHRNEEENKRITKKCQIHPNQSVRQTFLSQRNAIWDFCQDFLYLPNPK